MAIVMPQSMLAFKEPRRSAFQTVYDNICGNEGDCGQNCENSRHRSVDTYDFREVK